MVINKQRMLKEFLELIKVKCPSRAERPAADIVKQRLRELGATVREDDVAGRIGGNCGNVVADIKGSVSGAPVIMLTAHLDCVQPCGCENPQIRDGIIDSGGDTVLGGDDKAGGAAILEGLRVVRENNLPHGDIQVVFTVAEEGGLGGSENIDRRLLRAAVGYAFDSGGEPGKIIVAAPGQNHIEVVVRGKTAHAGVAPEEGINAIALAGRALAVLRQGRIDEETTSNVGIIQGGQATNIVPDKVVLHCEVRSHKAAKLAAETAYLSDVFRQAATAGGGQAEVKVAPAYQAFRISEDSPAVKLIVAAAARSGLRPALEVTGGGSDANFFNSYGIPTAVLGVGMTKIHTTGEYIREADLYKAAELAAALIGTAAGGEF